MQIINHLAPLRDKIAELRSEGRSIALVPTMGALHQGHIELVKSAQKLADIVVTSIFVNPTQFGEGEDLDAYPRTLESDAEMVAAEGGQLIWAPPASEVYTPGFSTSVRVNGLSDEYCGTARPGHFEGVALIVTKLFNQVRPDHAFFGEKDWQQLAVIKRLAIDLDFTTQVHGVPIVRDDDGLAMSSRNRYMTKEQRAAAVALPQALQQARDDIRGGVDVERAIATARKRLVEAGYNDADYLALVDAVSLKQIGQTIDTPMRLIAAAMIGKSRLLDNLAV